MWAEFPLIVSQLPEGWRLPSIITMIIQFGQIGSLCFQLFIHYWPEYIDYKKIIYIKFINSGILTVALSFLWPNTALVWGEMRSVYLYFIIFLLALFGWYLNGKKCIFIVSNFSNFSIFNCWSCFWVNRWRLYCVDSAIPQVGSLQINWSLLPCKTLY